MKITLNLEFDNTDDLKEAVDRITTPRYTKAEDIVKAIHAGDFMSLADTQVVEEAPTVPEAEVPQSPAEPQEPEAPEQEEKPSFSMTRAEVKAYCAVARTEKQVNIKEILNGLGAAKFTDLPDDKLGELYVRVKAARGD